MRFHTDTGGGFNAIARSIAERYELSDRGVAEADNAVFTVVEFPAFAVNSGIPRPASDRRLSGHLAVVPDEQLDHDGFLGSRWFAGKIWTFDSPGESLAYLTELEVPPGFEEVALGFRTDDSGARELDFPRITIRVDGKPPDMLPDTGATAQLTESAAAEQRVREHGASEGNGAATILMVVRIGPRRYRLGMP